MKISGILFDKVLLSALDYTENDIGASIEFRPQNTGCGADDHHFRLK